MTEFKRYMKAYNKKLGCKGCYLCNERARKQNIGCCNSPKPILVKENGECEGRLDK